ncbi:MAG: hypothetical protein AB7S26_20025 [Sandaracinaceae bacterium]
MTTIHAGATLERAPGKKYLERLDFYELAIGEPAPRTATLRGWAKEIPAEVIASLVVPKSARTGAAGPLRFDDEMRASHERAVEAADAIGARFVVLPTDAALTTGKRDRDLLRAYVDAWPRRAGRQLVWHPSGLWDAELATPFAEQLGVLCAIDPLESPVAPGQTIVYARLRAIGLRHRFSETLLSDAVDAIREAGVGEAFIAIESPRSFREASRLRELAE